MSNGISKNDRSNIHAGLSFLVAGVLFVVIFAILASADAGGSMMAAAGDSGFIPQFSIGIRGFVRLLFNLGIALIVFFLVATLGGIAKIVQIIVGMVRDAFEAVVKAFNRSPTASATASPDIVARIARLEAKTAHLPDPPKPLTAEEELAKVKAELAKLKGTPQP